jgi:hypothetical protein
VENGRRNKPELLALHRDLGRRTAGSAAIAGKTKALPRNRKIQVIIFLASNSRIGDGGLIAIPMSLAECRTARVILI